MGSIDSHIFMGTINSHLIPIYFPWEIRIVGVPAQGVPIIVWGLLIPIFLWEVFIPIFVWNGTRRRRNNHKIVVE